MVQGDAEPLSSFPVWAKPSQLLIVSSGRKFVVSKVGEEYDAHIGGLNGKFQPNSARKGKTMLRTILIILLVLFLLGALPSWPYSANWGYYPSGGLGLALDHCHHLDRLRYCINIIVVDIPNPFVKFNSAIS